MNHQDMEQAAAVLRRIPSDSWDAFLESAEGHRISERIRLARAALLGAGLVKGPPAKPIDSVLNMLGDGLLNDTKSGPMLRKMIIRTLPATRWAKLRKAYAVYHGKYAYPLHGNASQFGAGAEIMATYWHQGSRWAESFCDICLLPQLLASRRPNVLPADEIVEAAQPLPPLHEFQEDVYEGIGKLLRGKPGKTAILSLPTGAGKTRVAVEALLDHLALQEHGARRNAVLWIAQSEELLRQAWDCFRQVWQTAPERNGRKPIPRRGLLTIRRAWGGGLKASEMELDDGPTILLAGIQQLDQWINRDRQAPPWPTHRFSAVVVDEAHGLVTPTRRNVLVGLGLCKQYRWTPLHSSPPVIGLTATPWRTQERSNAELVGFFQRQLLKPEILGSKPIKVLQQKKFLAKVKPERLLSSDIPAMTAKQAARYEQFKDLPADYLAALGRHPERNGLIVRRLLKLPKKTSALVFACSVEHAEILTLALNQAGRVARCVTADTPRHARFAILEAFREKKVNFVCNVGVLTTGFDAPKIEVICITRPTSSSLLYEQMVGRGLRGPKNGGTATCLVLDVQDEGLPNGIMSYGRVLALWDSA